MTANRDREKPKLHDDTPKRVTTHHAAVVETKGQRFSPQSLDAGR
jgi:hypothetical protein